MSKKLAILGHKTRSEEVIELLKMLGGSDTSGFSCTKTDQFFHVSPNDGYVYWDYNDPSIVENKFEVFTLEEFLEKFPFKVGDFVRIPEYESEVCIHKMKWCPLSEHVEYLVYRNDDEEWYTADELLEYNDDPNKTRDCKKCGLVFGSVRCFGIDCPHNAPKSYAVGLKDGEVIDCIANKKTDMNKIKPLFKTGDVVKLKGCPDKNIFWIVMDVVKDGYIFNDAKKIPFDEQHHYEKSNREVINMTKETITPAPDITANITDKNNCDIACPDGYEFYDENGNLIGNKVMMRPKKPKYPTSYSDCCDILGFKNRNKTEQQFLNSCDLYDFELMTKLSMLKVCRDAYWKIAGEELELGKPWKPKFGKYIHYSINFYLYKDSFVLHKGEYHSSDNRILVFPIEEMRDAFYENFKDLIEYCKELL